MKIIVFCNFLSAEYSSLIINIFLIDTTKIENFNNLILISIKLFQYVCSYHISQLHNPVNILFIGYYQKENMRNDKTKARAYCVLSWSPI